MVKLESISDWKSLGLLPINLFSKSHSEFIMLNGGNGDFCLDINPSEHKDYFSYAWSSGTKNFTVIDSDKVIVHNWKRDKVEKIAKKDVEENYAKFYQYLWSKSYKSEDDIVPFIINIYRKLRNLTNEKDQGIQALNFLFLLFASYEENKLISKINRKKWGLNEFELPKSNFEKYFAEFSSGILRLKPSVELILRHSAGALFQEAHKYALLFNKQIDLFGTLSNEYKTQRLIYSSLHYTPAYLVRSIVETVLLKVDLKTKNYLRILDPACGTGEFLTEALKQLESLKYQGSVQVVGWDSSQSAVDTAKFLLTYQKREWGNNLNISIELVEDALLKEWDNDYDLILMNPPFVSWEQLDKESRETVREKLGNIFQQKPNQASAFIYKSVCSLKPEGVVGSVIHSSVLALDSYNKLRYAIKDIISLCFIGKLGNFIFEDALTDVSILIGRKPKNDTTPLLLWTRNEKGIAADALRDLRKINYGIIPYRENKDFSIYQPERFPLTNENWKILSYEESKLIDKLKLLILQGSLVPVQDIFNVKQGIRTGSNKVFKISKSVFYDSIPNGEKKYFRPVIDNDAIKKGFLTENNFVWYPYDKNGPLINNQHELQEKVPVCYKQILFPNKHELSSRARKNNNNWWLLSEHRAWLRKKYPKLISTEFGRAGSFAFDENGEFVIERGNAWIPKKKFTNTNFYYFYLALFSSPFFDTLLSIFSKDILSGYDLGKKYTKNIPIPNNTQRLQNSPYFEKLVDFGKQISDKDNYDFKVIGDYIKKDIYSIED